MTEQHLRCLLILPSTLLELLLRNYTPPEMTLLGNSGLYLTSSAVTVLINMYKASHSDHKAAAFNSHHRRVAPSSKSNYYINHIVIFFVCLLTILQIKIDLVSTSYHMFFTYKVSIPAF